MNSNKKGNNNNKGKKIKQVNRPDRRQPILGIAPNLRGEAHV